MGFLRRLSSGGLVVVLLVAGMLSVLVLAPSGARAAGTVFLNEPFDSWASLDPGWTITNVTTAYLDTYFDVENGVLVASDGTSNSYVTAGDYTGATATWTGAVSYPDGLVVSYAVYIPATFPQVIGYVGNVFHVTLFAADGTPVVSTRFGSSDNTLYQANTIVPPGFAYYDGAKWNLISSLAGGWHTVAMVLQKGNPTWAAYFDGTAYPGLAFSSSVASTPDLSKIQFANGLREEIQRILIDNVTAFEGTGPGPVNTPPTAAFTVNPSVATPGAPMTFNASASTDREDPTSALTVRWDWEDDGTYDTAPTTVKTASHSYATPGTYRVRLEIVDSGGLTAQATQYVSVVAFNRTFLMESFTNWSEVTSDWVLVNGTYYEPGGCPSCTPITGTYNDFSLSGGGLFVGSDYPNTVYGWPSNYTYASMDWTGGAVYSTTLETSFLVYLPVDPDPHIPNELGGGASVSITWYDPSGGAGLVVTIRWTTGSSWAIVDGLSGNTFETLGSGWHVVSVSMTKGTSTWSLVVDGTAFASPFTGGGGAFAVSKVRLLDGFTGAWGGMLVDDFALGEVFPAAGGNTAPAAYLTVQPTLGNGTTAFTLDASLSTDAQDPSSALTVRWDWEGDGLFDTDWTVNKTATHVYPVGGPYHPTVEVRDTGGLTGNATRDIYVDTTPPVAVAGPDFAVTQNVGFTFDGGASHDDTGIRLYAWTFGDGTPHLLSGVAPSYAFATPGIHNVTLTVTDLVGNVGTDSVLVTVACILYADAGPDQVARAGDFVTFAGFGSCADSYFVQYTWTFTENGVLRALSGLSPTYEFQFAGVYPVTLQVTDPSGAWKEDTMTLTVLQNGTVINKTSSGEKLTQSWNTSATSSGVWLLTLANLGFKSLTLTIYDVTGGTAVPVLTDKVRFKASGAYPFGVVTISQSLAAGHTYELVVTNLNGPLGSQLVIRTGFAPA